MHVLITGGWGFIGGRLAQIMQKNGHSVVLASRTNHNVPKWLPEAETITVDWGNNNSLEYACNGVDLIIHTAGMNAQDSYQDPSSALFVNGLSTENLINAAIKSSVKKFIYLSTVHVYANPLIGNIFDNTIPKNSHPYATSHIVGEKALHAAHLDGLIQGVTLRLSNSFGSPAHKEANCWMLLVNDICKQAVEHNSIIINSSGLQYRDFIPLSEVCRAILFVAEHDNVTGCFNVCSEHTLRVIEMAELVRKRCRIVLNINPKIKVLQPKNGEKYEVFTCDMQGLKNAGYCVKSDFIAEVDSLLLECSKWFTK